MILWRHWAVQDDFQHTRLQEKRQPQHQKRNSQNIAPRGRLIWE